MATTKKAAQTETAADEGQFKKSVCPVTRDEFEALARDMVCTINGQTIALKVHRQKDGTLGFSTGSLGWSNNDKITVALGGPEGTPVKLQLQFNATVVNSKEAK